MPLTAYARRIPSFLLRPGAAACLKACAHRGLSTSGHSYGVVLDIDGVLLRGGSQIPGAKEALKQLSSSHLLQNKAERVPYIVMTNGGGVTEHTKAKQLSEAFPGKVL